jgi:hypothetical protein
VRTIRILSLEPGVTPQDVWVSRPGEEASIDIPGGRVTFRSNGWSGNGEIMYAHLLYKPIQSGLVRFGNGPKVAT